MFSTFNILLRVETTTVSIKSPVEVYLCILPLSLSSTLSSVSISDASPSSSDEDVISASSPAQRLLKALCCLAIVRIAASRARTRRAFVLAVPPAPESNGDLEGDFAKVGSSGDCGSAGSARGKSEPPKGAAVG